MIQATARGARILSLAVLVSLGGCAEPPPGQLAQEGKASIWTVDSTPLRVIGEGDGIELGGISGVGLLANGTVLVVDDKAPAIWLFPEAGAEPIQVGRVGAGPGEYRFPQLLNVLADDGFAIYDASQRKVIRYGADGAFHSSQSLRAPTMGGTMDMPVGLLPNQSVLVKQAPMPGPGSPGEVKRMTAGVVVLDSTGTLSTSFGTFGVGDYSTANLGSMSMLMPRFLGWTLVVANSDWYVAIGEGDKYEIKIYDLQAKLIGTIREDRQPRPVTEERRAKIVAGMKAQNAPAGMTDPDRFAPYLPEFRNILVDRDGYVWVLPIPSTPDEVNSIATYTHEGIPAATVVLPARFDLRAVDDTMLAGVTTDTNDVQSVRVLRIRRGEGPTR